LEAQQRELDRFISGASFSSHPALLRVEALQLLIRLGVCQCTRTMPRSELPDLSHLMTALPEPYRETLEAAILLEEAAPTHLIHPVSVERAEVSLPHWPKSLGKLRLE
jgi:hypothetical protein